MSGLQDNLSPRHHNTTVLYHITSLLCQKIPWSYKMMSGSKAPDFDACGLLRATHSHNLPNICISGDYHPTFMLISGGS